MSRFRGMGVEVIDNMLEDALRPKGSNYRTWGQRHREERETYYRDKSKEYYQKNPTYIQIAYIREDKLPDKHKHIKQGQIFKVQWLERYNSRPEQDAFVIWSKDAQGNGKFLYFKQTDVFILHANAKERYEEQEARNNFIKRFRRKIDLS